MAFVWHWRSPSFVGNHIIDLYIMQELRPELFAASSAKYQTTSARKLLPMNNPVPLLNVYWNAVVHTATVHPQKVHDAKRAAGLPVQPTEYFEIPVEKLRPFLVVIWNFLENALLHKLSVVYNAAVFALSKLPMSGFLTNLLLTWKYTRMDFDAWRALDEMPRSTLKIYKQWADEQKAGKAPQVLTYQCVPHVFTKGAIPVDDLKVITIT